MEAGGFVSCRCIMYVSPGRGSCMCGRFAGPSKNGSSGHDEVSFQRPTNSIPAHSLLPLTAILTPSLGAESQRPSFLSTTHFTLIQTNTPSQGNLRGSSRPLSSPVSTALPVIRRELSTRPHTSVKKACLAKVSIFKESQGKELSETKVALSPRSMRKHIAE